MASPFTQLLRPRTLESSLTILCVSHSSCQPSANTFRSTFKINLEFTLSSYLHIPIRIQTSVLSTCKHSPHCCPCLPVVCLPPWGLLKNTHKNTRKPPVIPHLIQSKIQCNYQTTRPYGIRTPLPIWPDHFFSHTGLLSLLQKLEVHPHLRVLVPTISSALGTPSPWPSCPQGSPWFLHVYLIRCLSFPTSMSLSYSALFSPEHLSSSYISLCFLVCCLCSPLDCEFLVSRDICLICSSGYYKTKHIVEVQKLFVTELSEWMSPHFTNMETELRVVDRLASQSTHQRGI